MKTKLIILVIIVLVFGGAGYYMHLSSTSDWSIYRSKYNGYELKYPKGMYPNTVLLSIERESLSEILKIDGDPENSPFVEFNNYDGRIECPPPSGECEEMNFQLEINGFTATRADLQEMGVWLDSELEKIPFRGNLYELSEEFHKRDISKIQNDSQRKSYEEQLNSKYAALKTYLVPLNRYGDERFLMVNLLWRYPGGKWKVKNQGNSITWRQAQAIAERMLSTIKFTK